MPKWLKYILSVILVLLLVLKLFGLGFIISIWNNVFYIKLVVLFVYVIFTLYDLFELYLIHKFKKSQLSISELWPNFIINWLEGYKIISESDDSIKDFKNLTYTHVRINFFVILLIFIFL
jgi:hypothetical protein